MGGMRFELKPVAEKSNRTYSKRSKYGPIIDAFLSGGHDLVRVEVEGRDANYMRFQLFRVIESRELEDLLKASVVNGELYLEKTG
jgi:hypothetical protein